MKIIIRIVLVCLAMLLAVSATKAQNQPSTGTFGLSASVQSGQTNLQVPIWVTDNVTVAPIFGINYQQDNFTTLNFGVSPRFYQNLGTDFGTYIGAQGIILHTSPEIGDNDTDILIGPTGGGEYYLSEHFSMGVEGQLNFLLNDNGNNQVSTGAAIMATFYF